MYLTYRMEEILNLQQAGNDRNGKNGGGITENVSGIGGVDDNEDGGKNDFWDGETLQFPT